MAAQNLIYLSFRTLSLFKLRHFFDAATLLTSVPDLGLDPDSSSSNHYRYESHPKFYPNRIGSMIPFALRFLHADLLHRLGRRSETLDRLYSLLDLVHRRSKTLTAWKKRESFIVCSIIAHHFTHKEFDACLNLNG